MTIPMEPNIRELQIDNKPVLPTTTATNAYPDNINHTSLATQLQIHARNTYQLRTDLLFYNYFDYIFLKCITC